MAFSWRHQIKALGEAGIRVIAPDQRATAHLRPEPVEAYDIEHLTGDLVGLLDHLKIEKAIFVGHDWGGFIVWQMPLRHIDRVAGVVGINTRTPTALPADPIECCATVSATYVYRAVPGSRRASLTGYSAAGSSRPWMPSCASRCRADGAPGGRGVAGVGASPRLNLDFRK